MDDKLYKKVINLNKIFTYMDYNINIFIIMRIYDI